MPNIKVFTDAVEALNDEEFKVVKNSLADLISDKSFEIAVNEISTKVMEVCRALELTKETSNILIYLVLFDLSENMSDKIRYEQLLYMLLDKLESYLYKHNNKISKRL